MESSAVRSFDGCPPRAPLEPSHKRVSVPRRVKETDVVYLDTVECIERRCPVQQRRALAKGAVLRIVNVVGGVG